MMDCTEKDNLTNTTSYHALHKVTRPSGVSSR